MMHIIDSQVPGTLGLRLSGELSQDDQARIRAVLQDQLERHGGIFALVDISELSGVEFHALHALLDELDFQPRQVEGIVRCAVLGKREWQEAVTRRARPLLGEERLRFFEAEEIEAARQFLAAGEGAPSGAPTPDEVVNAPELDLKEKQAALKEMEYDEQLLQVADEEGFQGGRAPQLESVREAQAHLPGRRPIVAATDFSEESARVHAPALELAARLGTELQLVHVVTPLLAVPAPPLAGFPVVPSASVEEQDQQERKLKRLMEDTVGSLSAKTSVRVRGTVLTHESPVAALVEFAEEQDAELIAMASHARSGLMRLIEGSVVESVQRRTDRPVIVYPPDCRTALPERPHLGIAIKAESEGTSVAAALDMARWLEARVTLIHALVPPRTVVPMADPSTQKAPDPSQARREAEEYLNQVRSSLGDSSIAIAVAEGRSVEHALRRAADELCLDLLCMNASKSGGFSRLVFGSTAEAVLRHATTAVAVFNAQARQADDESRFPDRRSNQEHPMLNPTEAVNPLNKLIRGEISAIETYIQALDKFEGQAVASRLEELKQEHIAVTNILREHVRRYGGQPPTDSGPWGSFAKATEGMATLLGSKAAIRALREGEEHGVQLYEQAQKNSHIPVDTRKLIQEQLLPRQRVHVEMIRQLSEMV